MCSHTVQVPVSATRGASQRIGLRRMHASSGRQDGRPLEPRGALERSERYRLPGDEAGRCAARTPIPTGRIPETSVPGRCESSADERGHVLEPGSGAAGSRTPPTARRSRRPAAPARAVPVPPRARACRRCRAGSGPSRRRERSAAPAPCPGRCPPAPGASAAPRPRRRCHPGRSERAPGRSRGATEQRGERRRLGHIRVVAAACMQDGRDTPAAGRPRAAGCAAGTGGCPARRLQWCRSRTSHDHHDGGLE